MSITQTPFKNFSFSIITIILSAFILSSCSSDGESGIQTEAKYPTGADRSATGDNNIYSKAPSIFGDGGIGVGGDRDKDDSGASGIGVNSFLWRASLDTVSFMPLASADPFGGTILTDWYTPSGQETERYKLNVFILGRQLRSDGVRVRVFRQQQQNGTWKDIKTSDDTARQLEDSILTRARQLRVAQLGE